MKILIGTPIHEVKDYAMERWLQNVSKLEYSADLFLVDNSPTPRYVEQVKKYCSKYNIKKYTITHIDFDQGMTDSIKEKRIERCWEVIRQEVLVKNYDAWFSWECDQIIPTDSLDKLIGLIRGGIMVVVHNSWMREYPHWFNFDMGLTLVTRECLEKHGFLPKKNSEHWQDEDEFYKIRVLKGGGNYAEVKGLIGPIYHLAE